MVNQTNTAKTPYSARAIQILAVQSAARTAQLSSIAPLLLSPAHSICRAPSRLHSNPGAQGRIRTSVARKERQIYSLLPLTARPPVPIHPATKPLRRSRIPSVRCNHAKPHSVQRRFRASRPVRKTSGISEHAPEWDHRGGQARRIDRRKSQPSPVKSLAASGRFAPDFL